MSKSTVEMQLRMTSTGVKENVQETAKIHGNMKGAADEAERLNRANKASKPVAAAYQAPQGGTAGSRQVASQGASAALSGQEYGNLRGSAGVTGASARDFANQAQGLGGLVRLYATYAANLFAVTAAYNALSQAMNTDNMVKGMNQLGAASGIAMGTLAKSFASASGGAISLRESMEATAKAISSGMSQKQFLQLGDVAKKASQALGVNMSDAVSRLTRGITKLEPELLDELGLFTRVDGAVKEYAKSLGRSEASLTSFERRQAFANAVLKEGIDKFGEISIDTNPYDLLSAKLKDTAQSILSTINILVAPVAKLLSENTGLITASILGMAAMLVRQVIPIIGSYNEYMAASAKKAQEVALVRATAAKAAMDAEISLRAEKIKANLEGKQEAATARLVAAETDLAALSKKRMSKEVRMLLDPTRDLTKLTEKELAQLDDLSNKRSNRTGELTNSAKIYDTIKKSILEAIAAQKQFNKAVQEEEDLKNKQPSRYSPAGRAASRAESSRRSYESKSILSEVSENTSTYGIIDSIKKLNTRVSAANLGTLRSGLVLVRGAAIAAGTAVMGLASAIGSVVAVVGIVVSALSFLYSLVTDNGKEMEALSASIETSTSNMEAATLTAKKYADTLTPQSIEAKATALATMSEGLEDVALKAEAAENKSNIFSNTWERIKGLAGYGIKDDLVGQTSLAIDNASKLINDPELKKNFALKVQLLMNNKSPEDFYKSLDNKQAIASFRQLSTELTKASQASSRSAGLAGDAITSVKSLSDTYKELEKSLVGSKDPATELGKVLISTAQNFNKALESPKEALLAITELLKNDISTGVFGKDSITRIEKAKKDLEGYNKELIQINGYLAQAKGLQASRNSEQRKQGSVMEQGARIREVEIKAQIKATMSALSAEFQNGMVKGLSLIEAPIKAAVASAANATSATLAGMLPDNTDALKAKLKVDTQAIKIQMDGLKASYELVNALKVSALVTEKQNKLQELSTKMKEARDNGDNNLYLTYRREYEKTGTQYDKDISEVRSSKFSGTIDSNTNPAALDARIAFVGYRANMIKLESQLQQTILQSWYATLKKGSEERIKIEENTLNKLGKENKDYYDSMAYLTLNPVEQNAEKVRRDADVRAQEQKVDRLRLSESLNLLEQLRNEITKTTGLTARSELLDSVAAGIASVTRETNDYIESTNRANKVLAENTAINTKTVKTLYDLGKAQEDTKARSDAIELEQQQLDTAKELYSRNIAQMELEVASGRMTEDHLDAVKRKQDEIFAIKTAELEVSKIANDIDITRLDYAIKITEALKEGKIELARSLAAESTSKIALLEDSIKAKKTLLISTLKEINTRADTWLKTLQDTLTSSIVTSLTEGGRAGYENLKDTISQIAKEKFTIVISAVVTDGLNQLLSSIKSLISGKSGGDKSILQTLKDSTKKFDASISEKFNKFATGDIGKFLKLSDGAGKLTKVGQFASSAAQYGGRALAGYGAYKTLSGGYSTGLPKGLMNLGAGVGSAIFGPWVGAAMGVFNRAFGRKLADSGIQGKITKDGFTGENYQFYKGGWFSSNKTKTSAMSKAEQGSIADTLNMTKKSVAGLSEGLGLDSKKIMEYTKDIKISFKGLTKEQAAEKFAKEIEKFGEELAKVALGGSEFAKSGETSVQTLERLSNSLTSVNGLLGNINVKLFDISLSGADAASGLVDMLGGLDSAESKISNYYTKFFTKEEQLANLREEVSKEINKISESGYTSADGLVDTNLEFRALVESLDLSTTSGKEAFTSLMNIADSFNEVTSATESVDSILTSLRNPQRSNEDIANNILSLENTSKNLSLELLKLTGSSEDYKTALRELETKGFTEAEIALYDYNQSIQDQIDAINNYVKTVDELISESENATRSNEDIANSIISLKDTSKNLSLELLKLTGSTSEYESALRDLETKGFTQAEIALYDYNASLQDQIDAINNYVKTVDELISESENARRSNEDIANSIISLKDTSKNLSLELLKLTGSTSEYESALRDLETKGFTQAEIALYDYNASLQDQIDSYNKLTEAAQKTQEAMSSLIDSVVSIGNYSDEYKLNYQRSKILETTEDSLKSLQKYLFTLEDVNSAVEEASAAKADYLNALDEEISKQSEAIDKLKSTRDSLKGFISTLRDFSSSLKLGAESILTPLQKYDLAKSKFQEIYNTATLSSSPELREQALNQLSNVASEFLTASKEVNASSAAYTSDFNSVTGKLEGLESILSSELTDTEKALEYASSQLSVLEEQRNSLKDISTTLDSAYEKWVSAEASLSSLKMAANIAQSAAYTEAINSGNTDVANILSVGAFAKGGVASGTALVGENGAELVNFTSPGRVYSNNDSIELLGGANTEILAELVAMRKEVEKLRAQQTKETGDLIKANYDSQKQNANTISKSIETSIDTRNWNDNSKAKASLR